jgi:hypothetical protein
MTHFVYLNSWVSFIRQTLLEIAYKSIKLILLWTETGTIEPLNTFVVIM